MDNRKRFMVEPGAKVRLAKIDPNDTGGQGSREQALAETQRQVARMGALQYLLYANAGPSLLVVLQALDAAG